MEYIFKKVTNYIDHPQFKHRDVKTSNDLKAVFKTVLHCNIFYHYCPNVFDSIHLTINICFLTDFIHFTFTGFCSAFVFSKLFTQSGLKSALF